MIIALEGGVYSGKTSTATKLKEGLNFEIIPELMDTLTEQQKSSILNIDESNRFSRFLVFERYRKKNLDYQSDAHLILDRSFLTLFAFEIARGRHHNLVELFNKHKDDLIIPDKIYFLDVCDTERMRRIGADKDKLMECLYSSDFNIKIKSFFKSQSFVPNVEFIDTTNLTIEEVKLNILKTIYYNKGKTISLQKENNQR